MWNAPLKLGGIKTIVLTAAFWVKSLSWELILLLLGPGPPDTICLEFGCQRVTRMLGSPVFLQHPQGISVWFLQQWSWTLYIGSLGLREEKQWLPAPKEPNITSNIVCHSMWSQATHTEGEKEKMDAIDQQQGHYWICNHPQSAIRSGPSLGIGGCFLVLGTIPALLIQTSS